MYSLTNKKNIRCRLLTITVVLVTLPTTIQAQPEMEKPDSLQAIASKLDSLYFNAHNSCDLQQLRSLLASDIETFHDLGGYLQGRENFMETMRQFCSNPNRTQRSLDSGALEAYPMEGIGLLHKADHNFYRINDDGERLIGAEEV